MSITQRIGATLVMIPASVVIIGCAVGFGLALTVLVLWDIWQAEA